MSTSGTLNLNNYKTILQDNFGSDSSLNHTLWPVSWGHSDDYSFANGAMTLTSYASEGWSAVGFMQADFGKTSGQGYGLYSMTASADSNQGVGICIVMWPSDNTWPGPEIDLLEDWSDPTRHTGYATIHWRGSDGSNQYDSHQFSIDLTQKHSYAMDWERGALTYYIDGKQMFQVTGSEVPKDAADGGVNESFGAEVTAAGSGAQPENHVSLHIYSASIATALSVDPPPASRSIALSAPGSVQEASPGAGVDVVETATTTGMTTLYEGVYTSAGANESGWKTVAVNASGTTTFTAHFAHTGDYVLAYDSLTAATVAGRSTAVTITDIDKSAAHTITLSSPGTVKEASKGAGVTVTETAMTTGITTLYERVYTAAGTSESAWQKVALNGSGGATFQAHFANSGDYVLAFDSLTAATVAGRSARIKITDTATSAPATQATTTTTASAIGTVTLTGDNLTRSSPAWTVVGTLSASDSLPVSWAMGANPGKLFSISGNKLLINQTLPSNAPSSYAVSVYATDTAGHMALDPITVGVKSAATPITASVANAAAAFVAGIDTAPMTFSYHAGQALETIANFSAAQGDVLAIDPSLQGSLHETEIGGGTLLSFSDASHGVLLLGVTQFATSQIHWS